MQVCVSVVKEKAFAKINLSLDILGKREDGYHDLKMVMLSLNLYDTLIIRKSEKISLSCNTPGIPCNSDNTVWKAAELFCRYTGTPGADITLEKVIPSQAGMGGGSADAAAALRGLDRLYGTNLPLEDLLHLGKSVGADVPFCLINGLCLAEGIGEKLTPLKKLPDCRVLIAKPKLGISTGEAYRKADEEGRIRYAYTEKLMRALKTEDICLISQAMGNDFQSILPMPEVEKIRQCMLSFGALGAMMTGSGSAVFGIFMPEDNRAEECRKYLSQSYEEVFLCSPFYPEKI